MSQPAQRRSLAAVTLLVAVSLILVAAESPPTQTRDELVATMQAGNFKDAYDGLRPRLDDKSIDGPTVAKDLASAIECLNQLNRTHETDALIEAVVERHASKWQVLQAAAESYLRLPHYGFVVSGEFERGNHRGGGRQVNSVARDRARALQLLTEAQPLVAKSAEPRAQAEYWLLLSQVLLEGRQGQFAWQLQSLTPLDKLPDYDDAWVGATPSYAPVDAEGKPVLYTPSESWDAAKTDGERWRWALAAMAKADSAYQVRELLERAGFSRGQFGVETLDGMHALMAVQDGAADEAKLFTLHTLTDDECLARLATGVKRFELAADQHHMRLYQQAVELARKSDRTSEAADASMALAQITTDRRQYGRAADYWREVKKDAQDDWRKQTADEQIAQIEQPWGQFGTTASQPARRGAKFQFRFRNAKGVDFTAQQLDVAKLMDDVKAYLKSNPKQLDWQRMQIDELGYRIVEGNADKYIGAEVAKWHLDLEPREQHFDREVTVTSPLQSAGAYLVTAQVGDGNKSQIVLWVADTAIVKKPLDNASLYYVADAVTGKPVAAANIELFGYRVDWNQGNRPQVQTKNFAEKTDASGQAVVELGDDGRPDYQWLAIARSDDGRLAHLGFHGVWASRRDPSRPTQNSTFAMTDRPVYRPGQKVHMKLWVQRAQYDAPLESVYAHQQFQLELRDPKGEVVLTQPVTAGAYGGVEADYELPTGATLGSYSYSLSGFGGGSFRVEEYKKPEFEVIVDAPSKPVALGESFSAKVTAKYYFGSPVESGTLKYKVTRTPKSMTWFPPNRWDWLYGEGYWWFSSDAPWYPGWRRWGCWGPSPWWIWRPTPEPEIVAEGTTPLAADGTYEITIDTAIAKALHPNDDHSYHVEAEVVDPSRRTIVGTGDVVVAREPFQVFVWCDRGYYRQGDTITASFAARRADGKPVTGKGELRLFSIAYPADKPGEPVETPVRDWKLDTDAEGLAELQLKASDPGRYRISYTVTDDAGHKIEGAQLLTIVGDGFDGRGFVFNDLELVPDARNYRAGQSLKLQINTNRRGSRVLLFVRAQDGLYPRPQIVDIPGKSTVVDIPIEAGDSPNFFVEAMTVASGQVHVVARQIAVPPVERVVNVDVQPSSTVYKPGQEAKVTVKMTDEEGKPIIGETVLTVYDRALEYISGGSNVGDIRQAFWGWKRSHNPNTEHNLSRGGGNLVPQGQTAMQWLGRFGYLLADDAQDRDRSDLRLGGGFGGGGGDDLGMVRGRRMYARGAVADGMAMPMSAAAPAAPAAEMAEELSSVSKSKLGAEVAANQPGITPLVQPTIRQNFADTAYWGSTIETNSDGLAELTFTMPENTTDWSFKLWGMGHGGRVGDDSASAVTRKDLLVRLQTPRFLIDRDEVVLSANVHNYLDREKEVQVKLELEGGYLEAASEGELTATITIPADGQRRVDWRVKAIGDGTAKVRALALTDVESDAMQLEIPIKVHGAPKLIPFSGVLAIDQERDAFEVSIPSARRVEDTRLVVQFSPTLAGAMVDALPYLIDYPYGCTEQTLNRFLPAVLAQRSLQKMGLDLKVIRDKQVNLNPQELGDDAERAAQWKRYDRNPVFDQAELDRIVKTGVERLTEMQLDDGGWGWFSGWGEHSSPHTTATVLHGLIVAQKNDVALVPGVLDRGVAWLVAYREAEIARLDNFKDGKAVDKDQPSKTQADNLDAFVHMVLVEAGQPSDKMREYLYRDRTKLAPYCLAQLGMALHIEGGHGDQLEMVLRNLSQFVVKDDENQTAYLNLPEGYWWYWYGSEFEAQAYYLKLLSAHDADSPVASGLVKYLLNNRKHATYWNSTRDTALVIEAMADYLAATKEGQQEMVVEVWMNGQRQKEVTITPDTLFSFDNQFEISGDDLDSGTHTLELRKRGGGRLYYNAYLSLFSLEDDIRAAGLEVKVHRKLYKLTRIDATNDTAGGQGQVVTEKVEKYQREEIDNLGTVTSGDLIEVELSIDSKNDYEYLLFEDYKPAGCEPVEVRSGYSGNEMGAYAEYRDDRVALFVQRLARGSHSMTYRLRAEIPGKFSALPTQASAMYAPELRGNSDEVKVQIVDKEE